MSNNKYHGRSLSSINRDTSVVDGAGKDPAWLDDFVSNLEKVSAESNKDSTIDQINQILGNKSKSKYSNVEEAVLDMQKRTGLFDFLKKKQAQTSEQVGPLTQQIAPPNQQPTPSPQGINQKISPKIFSTIPEMKVFIDNFVEDRPGTSVEAVVHDLVKIDGIANKLEQKDVDDDVRRYINQKISEVRSLHSDKDQINLELGKADMSEVDDESNDPFAICEPTKM